MSRPRPRPIAVAAVWRRADGVSQPASRPRLLPSPRPSTAGGWRWNRRRGGRGRQRRVGVGLRAPGGLGRGCRAPQPRRWCWHACSCGNCGSKGKGRDGSGSKRARDGVVVVVGALPACLHTCVARAHAAKGKDADAGTCPLCCACGRPQRCRPPTAQAARLWGGLMRPGGHAEVRAGSTSGALCCAREQGQARCVACCRGAICEGWCRLACCARGCCGGHVVPVAIWCRRSRPCIPQAHAHRSHVGWRRFGRLPPAVSKTPAGAALLAVRAAFAAVSASGRKPTILSALCGLLLASPSLRVHCVPLAAGASGAGP